MPRVSFRGADTFDAVAEDVDEGLTEICLNQGQH
jgi:hypothetical protein